MPYQKLLKLELKSVGEIMTALPESSLSLSLYPLWVRAEGIC